MLAIKTPRGVLKVVQSENICHSFYVSIDNFEHKAADTGGPGGHGFPSFLRSKKKKEKQRKTRKTFKAETFKRLSLRSKLYCLSHSRASRIQKFFLSANHGG